MTKISSSPQRNSFQKESYLERQSEKGKTPENDEDTSAMLDYYLSWDEEKLRRESDPAWQKDNLEWDLRTTDWILEKVRTSDSYAQNLYAAMCNNEFVKREMWPILKDQRWSCSWRYAGGIIADMQQKGDYIDWYCSGIRGDKLTDQEFADLTEDQKLIYLESQSYVGESVVTDEIRKDLFRLGWTVIDEEPAVD